MTLDAYAEQIIDAFALSVAQDGKRSASAQFHKWANRQGWFNTGYWIPARTRFRAAHKAARAEYYATLPPMTESPPTVFLGDWRPSSNDWSDNA
jgi:hypothetical protein